MTTLDEGDASYMYAAGCTIPLDFRTVITHPILQDSFSSIWDVNNLK